MAYPPFVPLLVTQFFFSKAWPLKSGADSRCQNQEQVPPKEQIEDIMYTFQRGDLECVHHGKTNYIHECC